MDELSLDLYQLIFEFLDLYDLRSVRLVCKRFRAAVKEYKIRELSFTFGDSKKFNWFHTNCPSNFLNNLHGSEFYLLTSRQFDFQWLRKLKIDFNESSGFSFDKLANFWRLEHIELTYIGKPTNVKLFETGLPLVLPYLKVFSIRHYRQAHLIIDAPNLIAFDNNSGFDDASSYFEFSHPYSVRSLSVYQLDDHLSIFINLEYLEINHPNMLDPNSLRVFSKLKVLKMRSLLYEDRDLLYKLKELIFKNKHLKIYCLGVRMTEGMELDEYNLDAQLNTHHHSNVFNRTNLGHLINNYEKLDDNLDWISAINYNDLISLTNTLPSTIFNKFSNIQHIVSDSKINNPRLFAYFVGDCAVLTCLETKFSQLEQPFFDQLPTFSCLSKLTIYRTKELDFHFISRMFHLKNLSTNQDIAWQEDFNLDRLKFLEVIDFKISGNLFYVKKEGRDLWRCVFMGEKDNQNILFLIFFLLFHSKVSMMMTPSRIRIVPSIASPGTMWAIRDCPTVSSPIVNWPTGAHDCEAAPPIRVRYDKWRSKRA